ncbi:GNAT family N-acetyltransferase [Mucilaginibacter sp.]|uniref:GNAT family N-acetyltransferase n=1 Tax=Mucilaginibacter sp. TaxID=1882438 RepID=UPI00260E72FB|nr:GNAT family N-acetyltransferase [Mucilaginibacter sp.]MDB4923335.1 Acetyltransferase protein [Mucilaginibacter sp.]
MTKKLTIHNRQEWRYYVRNAAEYDFYHTWHFHSLETSDIPILFVYEEDDDYIAFPLLQRDIPGSTYHDLTCVYGFSGPISNKIMEKVDEAFIDKFKTAFTRFLLKENYVSVFARMHPFYKQQVLLDKFGGVHENGKTVIIDLSVSIEDQRKQYTQSTMDAIKHAWKMGYHVKEENGPCAVATFVKIYTETMRRVGATDYYLFNEEYFNKILNTDEYDARIIMVYNGDTVMSSTIITFTNGIIQAHLVGTKAEYLHKSPTKFLVDEITRIGRKMGMKYFNLGGGLGFKHDRLFDWKASFSTQCLDFNTWRFIANPAIYKQLLDEKGIDENAEIDFFPLYRYA